MAEVAEEQKKDQPAGSVAPVTEKSSEKYQETPEDVEKSRKYHQEKAQGETEKREQVEFDLEKSQKELDEATGRLGQSDAGTTIQPKTEPGKKAESKLKEPDLEEPGDDYVTTSHLNRFREELVSEVRDAVSDERRQDQEVQNQRMLNNQQGIAITEINKFAEGLSVPEDVRKKIEDEALQIVPLWDNVNGPPRIAKYTMQRLQQWKLEQSLQTRKKPNPDEEAAMVDHNKATLQPSGAGISPPNLSEMEKQMQESADDIAPDDPAVET